MRLLACCRRLWRLEPGLAWVWRDFQVRPASEAAAQALLRWVPARRHRLRRVELDLHWMRDEGEVHGNQTLYVAALLGGAPLEQLRVELRTGEFELGGWLAAVAPQLRALDVYSPRSIAVRPSFSLLTSLTCLKLSGGANGLDMASGCLPHGLREVELVSAPPTVLEGCLAAAAASLESCRLWAMSDEFSFAVLPRFTALTTLELRCVGLDAAPAELAALTGLQELRILGNQLRSAAELAPVAVLTRLTRLELSGSGASAGLELPEWVLRLPRLKVRRCFVHCPSMFNSV